MLRYIVVSVISGVLFGIMDGLINVNSMAVKLYEIYKPIARTSVNFAAGMMIDLAYGFLLAGLFLLLYESLPGKTGGLKGVSFGLIAWFLRVVMNTASQWMMFEIPSNLLVYLAAAGLGEMVVLGVLYGLTLQPGNRWGRKRWVKDNA